MRATSIIIVVGLVIFLGMGRAQEALAWGERGHHIVGSLATLVLRDLAGAKASAEDEASLIQLFESRTIQIGHLSNIPDISWRNKLLSPRVAKLNSPNHWFYPESFLGAPEGKTPKAYAEFAKKYAALTPLDYAEVLAKLEGKPSLVKGFTEPSLSSVLVYEHVGVTPWRAQQLFGLMRDAFACFKGKAGKTEDFKHSMVSPFADGVPTYRCQAELGRHSDLYAAVVFAGILSHFIGDHGQPLHPTADYDGWAFGNGRLHNYFETQVVGALDQNLTADVLRLARSAAFRKELTKKLDANLGEANGMVKFMHQLGADTFSRIPELIALDNRYAILKPGTVLAYGDHPEEHDDKFPITNPKRRPATEASVLKGFRPLVVQRLATSSVALAMAIHAAWELAGKPVMSERTYYVPYAMDPPFIWPDFDAGALERSKAAK